MTPLVLLLAFISLLYGADSQACTNGSVRLMYGSGPWEGNVQVCYNGEWGWVCDNSWTSNDARVVCNQLGYSTSNVVYRRYSYYGWGNGTIWLDYLYCGGYESNLLSCSHAYSVGVTYCGYGEMAGVFCRSGGTCTTGQIRLVNNYVSSYGRSEGRVEYCYNNQWGTVCDDGWSSTDARVACYQLGYSNYYAQSYCCGWFGWGSGNIWLDNVACSGSENSLSACSKNCIGCHNCYHGEDAGARCYSRDTSSCTSGSLRLWSAYNHPENEGMLQICKSGVWYGVCHYYYYCYIAKLACKQMGYSGALTLRSNAGFYYGYYYNNDNYRYYCYSYYSSFSQCYSYYYSSCGSYNDALGLVCYAGTGAGECTDGDVRFNGTGSNSREGRVEYCYEGSWAPFCYMYAYTANLLCNELGFTKFSWGTIINDERYGRSDISSNFNYIYCNSADHSLSDCNVYNKGGSCYLSTSTCSTEYSLRCYTPGDCSDGDVRLINGTIQQEGRVEVCINGVWSSVCQSGFNTIDAYVFCSQLGYDGPHPVIYYGAYFGETDGPVAWSYIYCNGWEQSLHECSKSVYPSFTCFSQYTVGVTCKESCSDGDVRLLGGGFENEGTVEVCFDNIWGLVSDVGWTDGDSQVVCNQLGYGGGIATPIHGSHYGKPNKTIHLKDVQCAGHEHNLAECTKTQLSLYSGKLALNITNVAGVDCIYDTPTEPPCVPKPQGANNLGPTCTNNGDFRLINQGSVSQDTGRVEYCYNGYWTPLCQMDSNVASVICRQLGHTVYTWATVDSSGTFGVTTNYSLFANLTCTGSETSISQCALNESPNDCTPWCPFSNIALRCFDPGQCTEGSVRLVDGIIENEGRVEFCVNGVWGSVCDDGWDKTDAHIVCTQLGHPELEPIVFSDSYFGDGIYPIIYSNMGCGGWESSVSACKKDSFLDFSCTRDNIAGVLCGYDCNDGDVRLVGGKGAYEGTIEVCFENLWGLVAETGWTQKDAEIVCKQLGYTTEGTIIQTGSYYGKPNKTIHFSDVQCTGNEETLTDCTATSLSLEQGKALLKSTAVAGVKCYTPDACVSPPTDGTSCIDKQLRLTGDNAQNGEGNLQYCYKGTWSSFCSLGPNEATVACRQLGFTNTELVSVYTDGRYGSISNVSLFQNFSCSTNRVEFSFSECEIADGCQSKCKNAIGLRCAMSDNCQDGDVRLVNGSIAQEGRVEVCLNSIWGSLCADGFDKSDGFVVCRELGLGEFEPTVYTNSYFGAGNGPVIYSNLSCRGYETTVVDCPKSSYGSFTCSRNNIAGLTCQDNCNDGDIKLVGGTKDSEGTVEICYFNYWGLITDTNWDDQDAQVVCRQLGYPNSGARATLSSSFGKPNKTVQLSNVGCNGTEARVDDCDGEHVPPSDGRQLYLIVDVAGVTCVENATAPPPTGNTGNTDRSTSNGGSGPLIGMAIVIVLLIVAVLVIIGLVVFTFMRHQSLKNDGLRSGGMGITMSGVQGADRGVENPLAGAVDDELGGMDKEELIRQMGRQ